MKKFAKYCKYVAYFFLFALTANLISTFIIRLAGIENYLFNDTARILLILQIIVVVILAWILGWQYSNKE
jgi:succinate dehydrogenase/fumarate reductase cytochrome b subunit